MHPIIGVWYATRDLPNGELSRRYVFKPSSFFTIQLKQSDGGTAMIEGRYTLSRTQLTLTPEKKKSAVVRQYSLDGNTLVLIEEEQRIVLHRLVA
jgi:hypothetical protein